MMLTQGRAAAVVRRQHLLRAVDAERQAEAGAGCVPLRRGQDERRTGQTFVIEDSVHGIAGAKAAGMRVIGFTGAAHTYPGHADG